MMKIYELRHALDLLICYVTDAVIIVIQMLHLALDGNLNIIWCVMCCTDYV